MSLTAAASGFLVLLLTVPVIQGEDDWTATYTSTQICALKGSTVEISCSYTHPSRINGLDTKVVETFWFTKVSKDVYVDLRTDPEYSGRVTSHCVNKVCTLRITDLRESDSAQYKFRFTTNQPGGTYAGKPGVSLSVTDLQVQVSRLTVSEHYNQAEMKCQSSCLPPGHRHYVWYKNGENIWRYTAILYSFYFNHADTVSCAVGGFEDFRSPSVYAPKLLSVSVSPSAEIVEGSSVTLTCSSDANPAANYTWYKKNQTPLSEEPQLVLRSIQSSDSGWYYCIAENQLGRTSEYINVKVKYAPKLPSVSVSPSAEIVEGSSVTLTCSSDANPAANYIWYKEDGNPDPPPLSEEPQLVFSSIQSSDSGQYYCRAENLLGRMSEYINVNVKYAPKLPSVSVSSSAEIVEGSSVTLTCSSDANPAAKYTWYKENQMKLQGPEGVYRFTSISSDRGIYYCNAHNRHGEINSASLSVDVQYAPKLPSVSVSPSAEIVEGSSVTLTCSSDANPAANYTWYKENQTRPHGEGAFYRFPSISSEDRGIYYCKSENKHGWIDSSSLVIDVQYAPKLPSVSVSPSAEIVGGSSVTLTCSSDANPSANYIWYKKGEDSPKASGQIFNITDFRAEHSGSYYCEAQNMRGRSNSTLHLTVLAAWKSAVFGTTSAVFLAIVGLSVFLLIRKKRASRQSSGPVEGPHNRQQCLPNQLVERDDIHYASIHFANNQTDSIYSNIRPAVHRVYEEVEYAVVKFKSASSSPRTRREENGEDPAELYSTVNKSAEHNRNH